MFMTLAAGILLIYIAVMIKNFNNDWLHPAVTFPLTWGVILSLCAMAEHFGYLGISVPGLLVYYLGTIFFMFGAIIGTDLTGRMPYRQRLSLNHFNYDRLFKICLLVHVVFVPLTLLEIKRITSGTMDLNAIAYQLRYLSLSKEDVVNPLVGNYLLSGLVFVPIMFIGTFSKKLSIVKAMTTSLPWFLFNLLVGGRSGLIALLVALLYQYFLIVKTINTKFVVTFLSSLVFIVVVGSMLVGKTDATIDDGITKVLTASAKSSFDYTLQGPILFSRYINQEININPTWDAFVIIHQIAEKFGFATVPTIHQQFAVFKTDGANGNVYSIFLSVLPMYGFGGVILILFAYGFWAAYHHNCSKSGKSLVDSLIAGYLFYAVIMSFYLDAFGPSIYFLIKVALITKVVEFVCYESKCCSADPRQICTEHTL